MSYKINLSPEVQLDFNLSLEYYLEISPAIALKFKSEFVDTLHKLELNPLLEIHYQDFRFSSLQKFHFVIIYTVDKKLRLLGIIVVFHTSRDPFDCSS